MRHLLAAAGAAVVAIAAPAQAAQPTPAVFNFTVGSNNNISNGNSRVYSATSPDLGTFNVRVTAWTLETVGSSTYVRDSKLMVYDAGFGVISDDDQNGANNQHTIDNSKRKDFLIFQFDRKVQLISAKFTPFSVLGGTADSDATIKYGQTNLAWTSSLSSLINDKKVASLDALFSGGWTSLGNGTTATRGINPGGENGNIWLIGADFINADGKIDGFKLTNLAVIPEPATWAMMIGGFGAIGTMARRRKGSTRAIA